MYLEDMNIIEQVQHHVAIYDRLQKQRNRTPADVMLMVTHANAITDIIHALPAEAERIRIDMLTSLGVREIGTT